MRPGAQPGRIGLAMSSGLPTSPQITSGAQAFAERHRKKTRTHGEFLGLAHGKLGCERKRGHDFTACDGWVRRSGHVLL